MANYELELDTAAILAAAQAACEKVTAIKTLGCHLDKYIIETSDDMTAEEVSGVEAAVLAIPPKLEKID